MTDRRRLRRRPPVFRTPCWCADCTAAALDLSRAIDRHARELGGHRDTTATRVELRRCAAAVDDRQHDQAMEAWR